MKIAILIGGIIYDSQKELIRGINDVAKEKNIKTVIFTCGGDIYSANDHSKGEFQIYSLPDLSMFDGVIVAPNTIQNAEVVKELERKLSLLSVDVIVIDSHMGNLCSFGVDNEGAIYDMTNHVITEHGKTKLLYISGPKENVESIQRLSGFLHCVRDNNLLEMQDYRVLYGDFWVDSGKVLMEECLEEFGLPEAVICANDYMAIGVADGMIAAGYQIPEDLIVTGFDNSIDGQNHLPRITTVQKPLYEMGREACRRLAEADLQEKEYSFSVKSIFSESCGCSEQTVTDIRKFKAQMIKEKTNNIRWAEVLNSMSADLNELSTLEEFIRKLKYYITRLNFPYFYMCLCEEEKFYGKLKQVGDIYQLQESENKDYTEQMQIAIAYENGRFYEPEIISKNGLLPSRFWKQSEAVFAVVLPIHFRLHCMGYCVVGNSSFPLESIQFQSWIMNLGNGLENIRKQMIMQDMIHHLNKMWIYDTMTGVLNRAGFYNKADHVIELCKEAQEDVLLMFVDADGLKYVNDNFGHEEGDFYIKSIAKVCQQNVGEQGIVMRYGGDEFVILKRYRKQDSYLNDIAEMKSAIRRIQIEEQKTYPMDISIGHYESAINDNFKLESVVEQADKDMYIMKKSKRERREN